MSKNRLEAFSDGVIAILITIMVLELRPPEHADSLAALAALAPVFLGYVLSFVYLGIYWNNHHHLFQVVHHVDGRVLWANQHLLFWLSLVPFATAWMGESGFATGPVALYGAVLLMAAIAYTLLCNHVPLQGWVIGAHEYEAHYAFDVWYRNTSDIKPKMVTGDMHSINKANFAIFDWFDGVA